MCYFKGRAISPYSERVMLYMYPDSGRAMSPYGEHVMLRPRFPGGVVCVGKVVSRVQRSHDARHPPPPRTGTLLPWPQRSIYNQLMDAPMIMPPRMRYEFRLTHAATEGRRGDALVTCVWSECM